MNPRPILIAVLAASLLLVGGAGAVAAGGGDGDPDGDGSDGDAVASSDGGYADANGVGTDDDNELPDTLPEAVGHALLLLGYLVEVTPAALGEVVVDVV